MYLPPAFRDDHTASLHAVMREARLATLVTATASGPMATPLPLLLDDSIGPHGALFGHVARANPHWSVPAIGDGLAIFMGPDAYVSPSWYATKRENGKVVPTWNYVAVHASGPIEFFDDPSRLLDAVTRLTNRHEGTRPDPWKVSDAPEDYMRAQLKGIIGVRMTISRLEGKRKLSQNRNPADREGVINGLDQSELAAEREVASLMKAQSA